MYLASVTLRILLAFAATWFVWGSTYLAIHFVVREMPPMLLAGLRNVVAGLVLYAFTRARGAAAPTPRQWANALVVGGLLLGIGNGAVTWAALREPSGIIALIVALVPLWLMVFGWFGPHRTKPHTHDIVGIALGFAGIALLVAPGNGSGRVISLAGIGVLLASTVAWSAGSLYSRSLPPMASALTGTGMEMLMGGMLLLLVSGARGDFGAFDPAQVTLKGVMGILYLIIFGSIIGFTAYKWLLTRVRPALAGSYAFVNPIVAVILGWLFAGERFGLRVLVASAVTLGGVALITAGTEARATQ